jgi:hypothetical protein
MGECRAAAAAQMPRIWLDYLELLMETGTITVTRRAFDRALAALPVTQHDRIWVLYLVGAWLTPAERVCCNPLRRCLLRLPAAAASHRATHPRRAVAGCWLLPAALRAHPGRAPRVGPACVPAVPQAGA